MTKEFYFYTILLCTQLSYKKLNIFSISFETVFIFLLITLSLLSSYLLLFYKNYAVICRVFKIR